MKHAICAALLAAPLVSCTSTVDAGALRGQLRRLDFDDVTLAEIEALEPQLRAPFRLAVTPPVNGLPWSPGEIAVIEAWGDELRRSGTVDELVVLPELAFDMDVTAEGGWLDGMRVAAARHRADALLVVNVVQEQSHWVNPLSVLDLTLIGLWIAPGHHAESVAVMEGVLLDNRNQYLYGSAITEGSAEWGGPLMYLDARALDREARVGALRELGVELIERAGAAAAGP